MNAEAKVTSGHLQRAAYLYIRQSTLHQVLENTESTERQYALRRRAVALGWPDDQIVVIDHDQGQSGASASDRAGFQRLVADVGLGKAGIVMGLEVSRLARNCADWHRLLEISALTHTLILDEDGVYDPAHYNDRLLLGLKGTMSEAELHVLRARLIGGVLNKAQRGDLKLPLPIGLTYDDDNHVELDPDQQVQESLRTLFATFARTGTARQTMQSFREQDLKFPKRCRGEILWRSLTYQFTVQTLHNPRYAGAFCFGRRRTWTDIEGKTHTQFLPRDQWRFVKKGRPSRLYHLGRVPLQSRTAPRQLPADRGRRAQGWSTTGRPRLAARVAALRQMRPHDDRALSSATRPVGAGLHVPEKLHRTRSTALSNGLRNRARRGPRKALGRKRDAARAGGRARCPARDPGAPGRVRAAAPATRAAHSVRG
jgi:DNA invertase Pin-like site-specific DNA recombinase